MFWHQKGAMSCDTPAHLDTLINSISAFLAGKQMKAPPQIIQGNQGSGPVCIIIADYVNKADADQAWTFVKNAESNAWIVAPSWASYASMDDAGFVVDLIERIEWW
jgi:hypothetical protein